MVIMGTKIIVSLFLKNVLHKLSGYQKKRYVSQIEIIAHKELIYQEVLASHILPANMERNGIQKDSSACALKIQNGMENNVSHVMEESYGFQVQAAYAQKEHSFLEASASMLIRIDV